jgi:hypothetical protein
VTLVSVSSAAGDVLATFAAAGIPATDDPRDFNPPGLLLGAPTVSFRYGKGCADLEWFGYLAAGNAGAGATLAALSGLVDRLDGTGLAVLRAEPYDLALPGGGDPVPAYRLTFNTTTQIGATP